MSLRPLSSCLMSHRSRVSMLAIAVAAVMPALAEAQEASPTVVRAPAVAPGAVEAGEIVVTAQRQSQSLEKVPLSVVAVSAQTLANLNIRNVDAIATVASGVVLDTAFSFPTFFIRGVGAQNRTGVGLETPVAIYIDGAYNPRNVGTPFDLYDAASVELLKGPQGTLYGRNASGGAILMKTADPTQKLEGRGALEFGSFGHRQADAMLNLPASDKLSFRFAGRYRDDDGFVRNVATGKRLRGRETYDGRAKVLWEPDNAFRAVLSFDYHHEEGLALAVAREDSLLTRTSPTLGYREVDADYTPREPARGYNGNLNLRYKTGDLTFTSTTNYRDVKAALADDNDHSSRPLVGILGKWGGKAFSTDLQVASSYDGAFDFIAGVLYARDNAISDLSVFGAALGAPYLNLRDIPTGATRGFDRVISKNYGAFAELYIRPIDRMTITLGGRYSEDKRKLNAVSSVVGAYSQRFSDGTFTPRAVVAYQLDQLNLYASYTKGYLAGGMNAIGFAPAPLIKAEKLDSYEIGAKYVSPDRRTRLNVAAFHYDYDNLQVSVCCTQAQVTIQNAAKARGKGIEVDFSHKPASWLNLAAGGSYLDAKFVSFPGAAVFLPVYGNPAQPTVPTGAVQGTADISGSRLPRAPKWSAYANIGVEGPIGSAITARLNASVRYSSSFFFGPAGGGPLLTDVQKRNAVVNVSGGISPTGSLYEIGFYIDNLTNTHYYANRAAGTFGLDSRIAMPRSIGARLKFGF